MSPYSDFSVPGYTILEQLGETHYSSVFRARETSGDRTVIIKFIRIKNPSAAAIARLRHEYDLIRSFSIDGIVKPLDFISHGGTFALILEDFGGVSLKEMLPHGFSMDRFLSLGIRLAEILGELHQANVSHRDIKPHNILINPQTDVLKITDFGISAEITHAHDGLNFEGFEGTMAYISPEQTGRMNCSVDSRTDLYSLGVTFYEMLTGRLPFQFSDPLEIIHAHIAKMPEPPCTVSPYVPRPVSDIVMKLLFKSPADRYQNGLGLAADLKECQRQLASGGRIAHFVLGSKDISLRFYTTQHLVGREDQLRVLFESFARVSQGAVEMVVVTGEPGIGKSSLVDEIQKPILEKRGYFIAGKFNRFQNDTPYSAIIQAFQSLIRQLLSGNDHQLKTWAGRLTDAVGHNGKILTDTIPEVEKIIGPQPDVPELGPEENQNRFNLVFKNLVRVFASDAHPLVVFLDDLQWADQASIDLLSAIARDKRLDHCLIVCAYRDTEVDGDHPILKTRIDIEHAGVRVQALQLAPLGIHDISQLITTFMRCEESRAADLARTIRQKTQGSPFFINQFLKTLYDNKHLRLDINRGWIWDMDRIRELEATENVVTFMAEKLHELPAEPLEMISLCSCIGHDFDMETLAMVADRPLDSLVPVIETFIQDGIFIRSGDHHRFYHNRIHEAAYSLVPRGERERIHYRIGMFELSQTPEDKLLNRIFSICDHLNHSGPNLSHAQEKILLAGLNLKAGVKAKESAAYTAALNYLKNGCACLPADAWRTQYELAYNLFSEQMECQYLCRNFDEAERLFGIISANAKALKDLAKAHTTMLVLYTATKSVKDTIEFGLKALKTIYNIRISPDVGQVPVLVELLKVQYKLSRKGIEAVSTLPVTDDDDLIARLELIFSLGTPAFYHNPNLFAYLVAKGFNTYLIYDSTWHLASGGCIALATIIQTAFGDYDKAYRLAQEALKLNQRLNDRKTAGMVHHIFAFFIQHWHKHARFNLDVFRKANRLSLEAGDFIYAGHSVNAIADCQLMIGTPLDEVHRENTSHDDLMAMVKDPFITARYRENNRFILNLKGQTDTRESLSGPYYDEEAHITRLNHDKNFFGLCFTLHYKVKRLYLYGMYDKALDVNSELSPHIKIQMGTQMMVDHVFYHSLVLTALMLKHKNTRLSSLVRIGLNQRKMKKWASLCPENFRHKYDLVEAEVLAAKGRFRHALTRYHRAINGARDNAYTHEEALACERLALFYLDHDRTDEAGIFMKRAHELYGIWGAKAKQDDLAGAYPDVIKAVTKPASPEDSDASTTTTTLTSSLDLSTVIKLSQVISGEIMLDRLLETTMHMSITNAGAERGCLIFEHGQRLIVQASEDINTGEKIILRDIPADQCGLLSPAIINYVHHSGENLILDDALNQGPFVNDPHVVNHKCKSILCIPVMNKGALTCMLYMENNLAAHAFTPERLEILRVITSQAAISLQNAKLYDSISKEITDRKKAEEAMGLSEQKYRSILEEMQDVYCETNLEGTVTFINPSACRLTGYTDGELVGSSFRRIIHIHDQKSLERYYTDIHSTGQPGKPMACKLLGKRGEKIPIEIVTSLIRDKSGKIKGFRNVGRDVSERKRLEHDLVESSKHVQAARAATILGLAKLAEYRDEDTGIHLERIREYARIIALELAGKPEYQAYITPEYIEDIYHSSILHDIGKVGVPDAILLKPGKLTPEEFEIIKTHSTLGGDALAAVERRIQGQTFLTLGKEIAYYHHEKWDGTGYPMGLKGSEIPLSARIVALADVYDALTSKRVYKEAFTHEKALDIITHDRGTHFAPDVVDAFLAHSEEFRRIREELFDESPLEKQAV